LRVEPPDAQRVRRLVTAHYLVLRGTLDGAERGYGLLWAVTKCLACHGILKKEETVCFLCGTEVPKDPGKVGIQQRLYTGIKICLWICSGFTIASIFTHYTPSFLKCGVATAVLGLAKNSMREMWEVK